MILLALALIDLLATMIWVDAGIATELNPLMDYFLKLSLPSFAAAKLSFTFVGVLILNKFNAHRNRLILTLSMILVALYSLLTCWHLVGFIKTVM